MQHTSIGRRTHVVIFGDPCTLSLNVVCANFFIIIIKSSRRRCENSRERLHDARVYHVEGERERAKTNNIPSFRTVTVHVAGARNVTTRRMTISVFSSVIGVRFGAGFDDGEKILKKISKTGPSVILQDFVSIIRSVCLWRGAAATAAANNNNT